MTNLLQRITQPISRLVSTKQTAAPYTRNIDAKAIQREQEKKLRQILIKLKKGHQDIALYNIFKYEYELGGQRVTHEREPSLIKVHSASSSQSTAILSEYDFSKRSMDKANLDRVLFRGLIFKDSSLRESSMRGAEFENVDFSLANFEKARGNPIFKNCPLVGAIMREAELTEASFIDSDLSESKFDNAKLIRCRIENVIVDENHLFVTHPELFTSSLFQNITIRPRAPSYAKAAAGYSGQTTRGFIIVTDDHQKILG